MAKTISRADLSEILLVKPATLARREKSKTIPMSVRVAGHRDRYYVVRDVVRAIKLLHVSTEDFPTDWLESLPSDWMRPTHVAAKLGVSKFSVLRWVREGSIPFYRLGPSSVRFRASEIKRWCRGREADGVFFCSSRDNLRKSFEKWLGDAA